MNRSELIETVVSTTGLEKRQVETAVTAFVDSVVAETKAGNKVSIFGFGTFTPTSRAARMGRNPRTGDAVKIAAKKGVRFAPARSYKETLNTRAAAKKAATKRAAASKTTATKAATTKRAAASKTTATRKAASRAVATKATATRTARATKGTATKATRSTKKR